VFLLHGVHGPIGIALAALLIGARMFLRGGGGPFGGVRRRRGPFS
jgi:hypothetical protein